MPRLRIIIDRSKCAGEGVCVGIAPEVFDLDEEGVAFVAESEGADEEALLEAMQSCPQEAISVIDEETEERLAA